MSAALSIEGIRKTFGKAETLKGIDLAIEPGGFLILVGPSGCGKSTLLNIVAGLDAPSAGRILLDGREITALPSKDRDIAMVFQSYALYPNMNVAENIAFALEMRGMPRAQREERVRQVARLLQIEPLLARKPGALSGGQRQRVAMGRALAREPKLFLFDEPLSNLDAKLRVEMRAEIRLLHQRTHTTTVYVTHDQVEAMTLGDRIAVMKDGLVQQFGTPEDIYARPATRFVAEFIGSPAMNFARIDCAAPPPALPLGREAAAALRALQGQGWYGVRPEHLQLAAPEAAPLAGELVFSETTGPDVYARVDTALGTWTARVPSRSGLAAGQRVGLAWSAADVHLFAPVNEARVG